LTDLQAGRNIEIQIGPRVHQEPTAATEALQRVANTLAPSTEGHLRRYLLRSIRESEHLPLRGLHPSNADVTTGHTVRLSVPEMFIDLETADHSRVLSVERRPAEGHQIATAQRLSPVEVLAGFKRAVMLAEPGGGKSTFVRHLTYCLAQHHLNPDGSWLQRLRGWPTQWQDLLVVVIRIASLGSWLAEAGSPSRKTGLLEAYLHHQLDSSGLAELNDVLGRRLQDGKALLVLDGYDELAEPETQLPVIREMIEDLPLAYPQTPMLVTCRLATYQDASWRLDTELWRDFRLERFNQYRIDRFIDAWYQKALRLSTDKSRVASNSLKRAVRQADLRGMAGNPLLLTLLALLHSHHGQLPDNRARLYEEAVDLLLWQWDAAKPEKGSPGTLSETLAHASLQPPALKECLRDLAYDMQADFAATENPGSDVSVGIDEVNLLDRLSTLHGKRSLDWARELLKVIKTRSGLLVEAAPRLYQFPHRTFLEYLAGSHFARRQNFVEEAVARPPSGWRQAIILGVGHLVYVLGEMDRALALIAELCPDEAPAPNNLKGWQNVWLAGECLLELGTKRAEQRSLGRTLASRVRSRLVHLITHDLLEFGERSEAGSILSALGDPRDFEETVLIPAGPFTMGSDDVDSAAYSNEKPQHVVEVREFRIGKYPVTNLQYATFVAATQYAPPPYWAGTEPAPEERNHPVMYVSWHDAMAYCEWRSRTGGESVRLPTEAEWEKAARGSDGRLYPWGGAWDPDRVSPPRTGLGGTHPVGIIAKGASPYGCLDIVGNVFEWCLGTFTDYPYQDDERNNPSPTDALRVLRGGCWFVEQARCACRATGDPTAHAANFGFRVVSLGSHE
jgi:formylglycine-generating enzyme required for sulfatase activity